MGSGSADEAWDKVLALHRAGGVVDVVFDRLRDRSKMFDAALSSQRL